MSGRDSRVSSGFRAYWPLLMVVTLCAGLGAAGKGAANRSQIPVANSLAFQDPAPLSLDTLRNLNDPANLPAMPKIAESLSLTEWLGPLAPVALSPFFGVACLSGIASYGPEWLQTRSGIFQESSPFNNPILFWVMAGLTVMTSLPRFTKVSKPLALLAEYLESYSVAIIFIAIRLMPAASTESTLPTAVILEFHGAGLLSIPFELAMALAAGLNILVINVIKLSLEFMIWITPIPFIDAMFEVCNKAMVGALMGLYCYSPLLATVLNLSILFLCLLVLNAVLRRVRFYRGIVFTPLLRRLFPSWFSSPSERFVGYLAQPWNGYPKYQRLDFQKGDGDWLVTAKRWGRPIQFRWNMANCSETSSLLYQRLGIQPSSQPPLEVLRPH